MATAFVIGVLVGRFLWGSASNESLSMPYDYRPGPKGLLYRIDKSTGEVWWHDPPGGWELVRDSQMPSGGR